MRRVARIFTAAFCLLPVVYGQGVSGSASVAGTVSDATGAVIPGAAVTLINVERGSQQEVSTNEAGNYAYPDITPGVYTVRVSSEGFETQEITDLQVAVGQRAAVNVELAVGQVTNVVTVEAAAVLLETESNAIGTVVNRERVNELPLNGRNFLQLALLAGGVAPAEGRASFQGQIGHAGRFVVIGGVKAANNSYTINGSPGARRARRRVGGQPLGGQHRPVQGAVELLHARSGAEPGHGQREHERRHERLPRPGFRVPAQHRARRAELLFAGAGRAQAQPVRLRPRRTHRARQDVVPRRLRGAARARRLHPRRVHADAGHVRRRLQRGSRYHP